MGNSYRHTINATIILSGAQLIEAIISLIRAKMIAILLGPIGVALNSIFQITLNTLYQLISCGLPQSAIRDISSAYTTQKDLTEITSVFYKLMTFLSMVGLVCCVAMSYLFSLLSFGKKDDHTIDFMILAIGAAAMVLSYANVTVLQGTQKLMSLGKTTIFSAFFSLLTAIPFFFLLGNRGIAWALSSGYIITLCINTYFTKKLKLQRISIPWKEIWHYAAPMIKLGVIIMISSLLINFFTYFTNVLIRYFGTLEDVGYYQAGFSLTIRNFSILSAVLAADFYPRLSGMLNDKTGFNKLVSEQAEMLLLIIAFVSMLLIVFAPWIIEILLSEEFQIIKPLIQFISYSFVFRVMWLTTSYIALAKGDKIVYLIYDAIIGNGGYFLLNIIFYYFWGINGLGISCIIGTIFVSLLLLFVYTRKYDFSYSRNFWQLQITCVAFLSSFLLLQLVNNNYIYITATIIIAAIYTIYIYKELDKRLQIKQIFKVKLKK